MSFRFTSNMQMMDALSADFGDRVMSGDEKTFTVSLATKGRAT